jgi:CubicO group peptidase (beta-lactamase class C family)
MLLNRRLFIQQAGLGAAGFAGLPVASWPLQTRARTLPRSLPEAQGVASSGVLDFINAVESARLNVHSLMLVRRGQVVAEGWWAPYASHLKHTMYSLSKSFTSTAVGMAVAEGRLKVDDKVVSFFPQDLPATISPNLAAL